MPGNSGSVAALDGDGKGLSGLGTGAERICRLLYPGLSLHSQPDVLPGPVRKLTSKVLRHTELSSAGAWRGVPRALDHQPMKRL